MALQHADEHSVRDARGHLEQTVVSNSYGFVYRGTLVDEYGGSHHVFSRQIGPGPAEYYVVRLVSGAWKTVSVSHA